MKTEDPWSNNKHDDVELLAALEGVPDVMMSQSSAPTAGPVSSSLQSKPYTYLQDISQNLDSIEVVKGCIVSLASKLTVGEDSSGKVWRVKVLKLLLTTHLFYLAMTWLEHIEHVASIYVNSVLRS